MINVLALAGDKSKIYSDISLWYRKRDKWTDLMAYGQNYQQWTGDLSRKYFAVL